MRKLVIENNQLVLNNLVDSKTGEVIRFDLPSDPKERAERLSELQEIADRAYADGKATREMLSKPCECGCGR